MIRNNNLFFAVTFLSLIGGLFLIDKNAAMAQGSTINASVSLAACGNGIIESGEQCDGLA